MLLSCKKTARLLSRGMDHELAFGERVMLRLHLAICDGCSNAGAQFKFLREAVRGLAESEAGK